MPPILICPSILSANFACLADQIHAAEQAGADWFHVDVMDGHFVPNLTMGPFIVETLRKLTTLPIDVHLMVTNPDTMVPWYASAGASRISVQIETAPHIVRTLDYIRELNCLPGVVLNPGTSATVLEEVLPLAELVLVMTVNPGYSGQTFLPQVVKKIARIHTMIEQSGGNAQIQVDGGIDPSTLPVCYRAGARVFVSATAIFKHPQGIAAGISALRSAID